MPTGVVGSAVVDGAKVMLSPFRMPLIVPVNTGFGSPYTRVALARVTDSGCWVTVRVPVALTV